MRRVHILCVPPWAIDMLHRARRVLCAPSVVVLLFLGAVLGLGRSGVLHEHSSANVAPSLPGPTFAVPEGDLRKPVTLIAYGDMRFTDRSNVIAANPGARQALVTRIAAEMPDAVFLTGDVPYRGGNKNDYAVYLMETEAWRRAHLRVYPALGNHEFSGGTPEQCLQNWWQAFPELRGLRWYSVRLGARIYAISLDSNASLLPGSEQYRWFAAQIASLPGDVAFVIITLHHPPVADIQRGFSASHNPRANEIALMNLLKDAARTSAARSLVVSGHIHNYERFSQDDVVYLVSGGGGAVPYTVERSPKDLYQDRAFPNFHFVKLVLTDDALLGTMYRLSDLGASTWEIKDAFTVPAKRPVTSGD